MRAILVFVAVAIFPAATLADNVPKYMDRQANPIEVEAHSRVEGYPATSHNLRARVDMSRPATSNVQGGMPTPDGSLLVDVAKGNNK